MNTWKIHHSFNSYRDITYYCAILVLLSLFGCSDPPPPTLLYEDRAVVDSLYQIEYKGIVDSLDANCERMQSERLDPIVDSLLKIRLVEIIKQKQRYKEKEKSDE